MKLTFIMLSLAGLFLSLSLVADNNRMQDMQTLTQAGQMLSMRLVVGEPVRIFVVGREEAKIDLSSLKLTVRRLSPYPAQELKLNNQGEFFTIAEPVNFKKENVLEFTAKLKNKTERFKFKVRQAPLP